jgi:hypothetical protein
MGMQSASVQSPQTSSGKGSPMSRAVDVANQGNPRPTVGKGGGNNPGNDYPEPQQYQDLPSQPSPTGKGASGQRFTYSPTSGQPQAGSPNQYTNTVGQWDNAQISQPTQRSGKGKG